MKHETVFACDMGGTNLRLAIIDAEGKILHRVKTATPQTGRAVDIIHAIAEAAEKCRAKVGEDITVKAFGAAVPATINALDGIVLKAPNIPGLDGFQFSAALSNEISLPVILENDANAAAIGEQTFGAARGFQDAICVTLGTGVGGGIIINGKVLRGVDGTAGEIGHICVEPFGAPCGCGSRGCLEQYSSATAVVRLLRELEDKYPHSSLYKKTHVTSADVYQAGKKDDALAIEVFRQMGFYLGIALAGLINVLNPEVIVIGGGASASWDLLIPNVEREIMRRAWREPAERAKLVHARLGDDAGILGAAQQAFQKQKQTAVITN